MLTFLYINSVDLSSIARTSVAASNSPLTSYTPAVKKEGSIGMSEEDEVRYATYWPPTSTSSFPCALTPVFLRTHHPMVECFQPFRLVE